MRGKWYQISLIFLGLIVSLLFGVFFLRELFPEYRIYQNAYIELEKFRSTYTAEPPPPFETGIKQLLVPVEKGPEKIDRCTSCHVALQFEHFSPLTIAKDINGNTIYDAEGIPEKIPNENYIWKKLDEKIEMLISEDQLAEADELNALTTAHVGEHVYDMRKVLNMHPLIGRETRPFEFHPIDEYGCTVCHNGNGRGLVTDRAHGPVFDGQYEEQSMGPEPEFLESDLKNDPDFARAFNHKPGHRLLFQTSPLFVGDLIEAKCVQCHRGNDGKLLDAAKEAVVAVERRKQESEAIQKAYANDQKAFISLIQLRQDINSKGYKETLETLRKAAVDYTLSEVTRVAKGDQLDYLLRLSKGETSPKKEIILENIDHKLIEKLGNKELLLSYLKEKNSLKDLDDFIEKHQKAGAAVGTLFSKKAQVDLNKKEMVLVKEAERNIDQVIDNENVLRAFQTNIDHLIQNFHQGKSLFISQACYACHRIEGFARGGIGPELSNASETYPWFLKESIVWPQADLKTSTMPNFRLDHVEVEDLMTFLLAQHGRTKAVSEADHKKRIIEWEEGAKMPWEKPINPGNLHDLRYSMTVFANEGCAACHRLKGFESDVGFAVEKTSGNKPTFDQIYPERQWFQSLFPEQIFGSDIVKAIENNTQDIDKRIAGNVRAGSILEEIEEKHPGLIESFYSNFAYAKRAKNHEYQELAKAAANPEEKKRIEDELAAWKKRVRHVLMMYVQEYGLGRLIGPRPNWSGIYRSDEWLIEHFRKPSRHTAKSIMPVMPFDDSKYYALTYMLDELAKKNRDEVREIWEHRGFQPELAYEIHCSQCHGKFLHGNGPVAEWIYPIPKNLRNADFLTNYTRENVINSIIHGVKGTPMPPWGETAPDKPFENNIPELTQAEIEQIADWLFSSLLSGTTLKTEEEVPKWEYGPDDVIEEMEKEGNELSPGPPPEFFEFEEVKPPHQSFNHPQIDHYFAGLQPWVVAQTTPKEEKGLPQSEIEKIFDIKPNPPNSPEKYSYYIKEKYYTENNIAEGQRFFELNCAVCHGREADGQGFRAGTMYDAKPRMLTNLHWLGTRDDLRLIRSIKYGVPGTAMTPWGDLTSSLQRLQLVIFIRSLSIEQEQRDELFDTLYQIFDVADQTLDTARVEEYRRVNELQEKLEEIKATRTALYENIQAGASPPEEAVKLYSEELAYTQQIRQHQSADEQLDKLKALVEKESSLYRKVGVTLIGKSLMGEPFRNYLELVAIDNASFSVEDGKLRAEFDPEKEKQIQKLGGEIVETMTQQIKEQGKELNIVQGMLPSKERREKLEELTGEYKRLESVKNSLISTLAETARLRDEQKKVYNQYLKKLEEIHGDNNKVS